MFGLMPAGACSFVRTFPYLDVGSDVIIAGRLPVSGDSARLGRNPMGKLCPKCQRPLPERQAGAGRPKVFCSPVCQRASGFEISRVTKLISDLEDTLSKVRCEQITPWTVNVPLVEIEVAHLRERLHELLLEPAEG
jgi:hypothetical protein